MMQMFKTMKEQALNRQLGYRTFAALLLICLWGWMPATAIAQETTDSLEVFDYSNPKDYEIGGIKVSGAFFSDDA